MSCENIGAKSLGKEAARIAMSVWCQQQDVRDLKPFNFHRHLLVEFPVFSKTPRILACAVTCVNIRYFEEIWTRSGTLLSNSLVKSRHFSSIGPECLDGDARADLRQTIAAHVVPQLLMPIAAAPLMAMHTSMRWYDCMIRLCSTAAINC